MRLWKAEVWAGFVANYRVDHFSDERDGSFSRTIGQHPHERPRGGLLRILGKVDVAKVCVIRPTKEFDGGGVGKNVGEGERLSHGCRALSSKRWDKTERMLREKERTSAAVKICG
jgi:hypothetical protein